MPYGIRADYRENQGPCYFLDDVTQERGIVFQPDVYTMAEFLAELGGYSSIIDVGCGWGDKLVALRQRHRDWDVVGYDFGANIIHCREAHGDTGIAWVEHDLETPMRLTAPDSVIICSDVIEHLVNPTELVRSLRDTLAPIILISTPERNVQWGFGSLGPSQNPCHVREWTAEELVGYLTSEGVDVIHAGLTRGSDQSWVMPTSLIIARGGERG